MEDDTKEGLVVSSGWPSLPRFFTHSGTSPKAEHVSAKEIRLDVGAPNQRQFGSTLRNLNVSRTQGSGLRKFRRG